MNLRPTTVPPLPCLLLYLMLFLPASSLLHAHTAFFAGLRHLNRPVAPSQHAAAASPSSSDLVTSYEWLARERDGDKCGPVSSIAWFDPANKAATVDDGDATTTTMPLYPLGACYVPSGCDQILNNVQSRNLRMAQDLRRDVWSGDDNDRVARFCASLVASDTGRIASIGTIMEVVKVDEQRRPYDDALTRIIVTCRAVGIAEIVTVENPEAWSSGTAGRRSGEYLVAHVRVLEDKEDANGDIGAATQALVEDYAAVRSMYVATEGVAAREMPPFAVEAVRTIPEFKADDVAFNFWAVAEAWQTLCNTVRHAKRADLLARVNEVSVEAAVKAAERERKVLKLPVHREDLPMDVQSVLRKMEEVATREFISLGLDPCLDFQALLSSRSHIYRVRLLGAMVSRERRRLTAKESLKSVLQGGLKDGHPSSSSSNGNAGFE